MILITSAAYITPALSSEFGKIPPCMLPVQNKRLYEHQCALVHQKEPIIMSLPYNYKLSLYDKKRLIELNIQIISTPENLTLGQSIVYTLNTIAQYDAPLYILHGDTLFSELIFQEDICAIAQAEDNYNWDVANMSEQKVYSGFFSFSNQSLLIKKITECKYNFIEGVRAYNQEVPLKLIELSNWMDFGLINSYYRSISKLTTQRAFNSLSVTRYSVRKYSLDTKKINAEANWLSSLSPSMKHYVPGVWDEGTKGKESYYEIEYFYLSSLASLYVFGENPIQTWKEIISSCITYLNEEFKIKPKNTDDVALKNDFLYATKSLNRLEEYSKKTNISLNKTWILNGISTPSLYDIIKETDAMITKHENKFVSLMHGDFCFSNILYDFKSKSIKLIDPRGIDALGNICIYGDIRYDVAKLAHSIIGMYDFIIAGMYNYSQIDDYSIEFHIEYNNNIREIQNYFTKQNFAGYNIAELSTYPILIQLFIAMLPLHSDNPKRQKAMLANALRLYLILKNK